MMKCQICGCTDKRACPGGCIWILPNLCSNCENKVPLAIYVGPTYIRGVDKFRFECPSCKHRFNRVEKNLGITKCPGCKNYIKCLKKKG